MSLILVVVAFFLVMGLIVRLMENRLAYFPTPFPENFSELSRYGLNLEDVFLATSDGKRIHGWFHPVPESPSVLLWFHGNAGNLADRMDHLQILSLLGVNVFAIDYRGYGKSEGSPDEEGIYRDADAAYRFLTEKKGFAPARIIVYGISLGSAVAMDLAVRKRCAGLILSAPFTSAREMTRRMFRIPFLEYFPRTRFDNLRKIAQIRVPVLILHGTQDDLVPFEMGKRLFEAANEPKTFFPVEGAGHNDIYVIAQEDYLDQMRKFVDFSSQEEEAVER